MADFFGARISIIKLFRFLLNGAHPGDRIYRLLRFFIYVINPAHTPKNK